MLLLLLPVYQAKKKLLQQLMKLEGLQTIQLYFTDEVGFNLTPSILYGWIPIEEHWGIRSAKDRVCNLLGLLSRKGDLMAYSTPQKLYAVFAPQSKPKDNYLNGSPIP